MKLLSLKILGTDFRSLAAHKPYIFNQSDRTDRLSTKIFAGLNGSGKSNILELLSEIFYFLEIYHLSSSSPTERIGKNIGFEIEYLLPKKEENVFIIFQNLLFHYKETYISNNYRLTKLAKDEFELYYISEIEEELITQWNKLVREFLMKGLIHVRIIKEIDQEPKFYLKNYSDQVFKESINSIYLLPKKIVAYTSGQNELISNPYNKIRFKYFEEFQNKPDELDFSENNRLFLIDYSSNFSIFISNMLLADVNKLNYLKNILNIVGLHSFRVTINLADFKKVPIKISNNLSIKLDYLRACSTSWTEKKNKKEHLLIFDYSVNTATLKAFKYYFGNSFNLFRTFYQLDSLNIHLVDKIIRNTILKSHKSLNLSDELPTPDPSRLAFRIEKIRVNKIVNDSTEETKDIYYKGLSDGEHQFNEVLGAALMMEEDGCLFLMDEPDTHFNPLWRARLIKTLNYVSAKQIDHNGKVDEVRKQEIIITTHSPFVISDSFKEDVYKFIKTNGIVEYSNPKVETYGASISLVSEIIFDRDVSISDFANYDLEELKKTIKQMEDIEAAKRILLSFGESLEKFDMYSYLREKEKEFSKAE